MIARTAEIERQLRSGAAGPGRWIVEARRAWSEHQAYRNTVAELGAMSDRDLADIGISRLVIREVARNAVYGK